MISSIITMCIVIGLNQVNIALVLFVIAECGNLFIHLALRDLRPKGSTERKIPFPTGNLHSVCVFTLNHFTSG